VQAWAYFILESGFWILDSFFFLMKILLIEYRDMKHPLAGGAEIVLYEIFRRIVALGHQVDYLCNGFEGGAPEEVQAGIRIIRRGRQAYFNYMAPWVYQTELRANHYDLIIEGIDKIPFYLPLFERKTPIMAIVPHLFGSTVFQEVSFLPASYVYLLERGVSKAYRRCMFSLLSKSTQVDLVARGIPQDQTRVIHPGFTHEDYPAPVVKPPRTRPTFIYVGRIKRYKGIQQGIQAVAKLKTRYPDILFQIVGAGDYLEPLRKLTRDLGVEPQVEFTGRISHDRKIQLMQQADVLIYPSPKEGWGLSVLEANSCGTVVVASDSPGLNEAVQDGKTGFLVPHGDVPAMVARLDQLLGDPVLYAQMRANGLEWVKTFTWDKAARATLELMEETCRRYGGKKNC
jgi:glycosyltransferase involved in cell wall biosynthesis